MRQAEAGTGAGYVGAGGGGGVRGRGGCSYSGDERAPRAREIRIEQLEAARPVRDPRPSAARRRPRRACAPAGRCGGRRGSRRRRR